MSGLPDMNHIAAGDGHGLLAIDGDVDLSLVLARADDEGGAVAEDEGTIGQDVRADGCHGEDAAVGGGLVRILA